ncbi:MAG TPA: hypothetical protein VI322_04545 [Candidatus Saccharimonadia bacterium]
MGQDDLGYFRAIAQTYHHSITDSRLEIIAHAGHMVNLEAPDHVNQLILEQLRRAR